MSDKPLHVRVAEALGIGGDAFSGYPHFDIDWRATGPLIERFRLDLLWNISDKKWVASTWRGDWEGQVAHDASPLVAVCNLILSLSEAGKL